VVGTEKRSRSRTEKRPNKNKQQKKEADDRKNRLTWKAPYKGGIARSAYSADSRIRPVVRKGAIRASRYCALVWGFPSQAVFSVVSFFLLLFVFVRQFLGSTAGPFLRPDHGCGSRRAQPPSRLAFRPPPEAARSGLDGGEHGARLFGSGGAIGSIATGRIRSGARLPRRSLVFRSNLVFGTNPFQGRGP